MRSYREAHPEYPEIRLLTLDGFQDTRVAVDGPPNVEENEGDQPWFRATMAADSAGSMDRRWSRLHRGCTGQRVCRVKSATRGDRGLVHASGSAAATAFVFLALSRLVLAPLRTLDRQARHIGSERFDPELCVRTDDKLGELAHAFVDMGQRLRVTLDELRRSHDYIETLAYQDSLTRLFNRRRFLQVLEASLETATVSQSRIVLYFLDLDDFKIINDTLGHDRRNEPLVEIAERLSKVFDTNGERHVARLGGDEFTAILPVSAETFSIERFTETLCQTLGAPIQLGGQELVVATRVGVAVFTDAADSIETLMRCADAAMINAKRQGKGTWFRFDSAMNDALEIEL